MRDNRIGNASLEIINIGHASLNYDMVHQGPGKTSGELWLTDLPNLGLLAVGFAICVRSCIGIPRHVVCQFEDTAFLLLADLQSEGWGI